ncbi:hypothetical protein C0585_01140 [Candidatus Woesearchaeota archaeon]|nr:MAG: hypothetical protein C0585_01140 [Candidatus Woesearchaeota archaeon]
MVFICFVENISIKFIFPFLKKVIMDFGKEIKKLIEINKKKLGIKEDIKTISISKLGVGENNYNFLAIINNKLRLVFRIPYQKNSEKNIKFEHEELKKIPKGLGPKPIFFDDSKKIIPKLYSVQSFVEGKHLKRLNKKRLTQIAKKLALLHKDKKDYCKIYGEKRNFLDIHEYLIREINNYSKHKSLFNKEINIILENENEYFKSKKEIFLKMKNFPRVHVDPCLTNLLFTKDDVNFIDWEWATYRDNAEDLAVLIDTKFSQPPWKIRLNGKRLDFFISEYQKYNSDENLKERVLIWVKLNRVRDLLFFKWKLSNYDKEINSLPREIYKKGYDNLFNFYSKK